MTTPAPQQPLIELPPLKEVIARYGLAARKGLGQHFLLDLNLTRRIARAAGDLSDITVVEIGPGPGGLTRPLLETKAKRVLALEKDPRCVLALEDLVAASAGRLEVQQADALKIHLPGLVEKGERLAVVANLPYNVGTALLVNWLHDMPRFESLTLLFQAEVVERIVAAPGEKAYGRLSVLTHFCAAPRRVLTIGPQAFTPPPKVSSALVHLTPRQDRPKDVPLAALERITAAAFGQRRKMLRASLKALGGETLLRAADIDPARRAETLSLAEFETLARALPPQKIAG